MFRTLPVVAMRQKHDESAKAAPFLFARGDELIDDNLRTIREVAELALPHNQRVLRDAVAQRILDPKVLTKVPEGHNSSADLGFAAAATDFAATWQSAHGVWSTPSLPFTRRTALLDKLWAKLAGQVARSGLAVEPLFGGACADEDACVAVRVADGKCVCATAAGHAGA